MNYVSPENQIKKHHPIWKWIIALTMIVVCALFITMYLNREITPHLLHQEFSFACGEELPTNSDAYLSYDDTYDDVVFDASLFTMKAAGTYEIPVEFANQTFTLIIHLIDTKPPAITFVPEENVELYRFDGVAQVEALFTISDVSSYTYEVTPASKDLKDGEQEVCVIATDEYDNETEACKFMTLSFVDLAMSDVPSASSIEALLQTYMQQRNLNEQNFGFYFYSTIDQEEYIFNDTTLFQAASTIKVPLNMLYYDRYEQGLMSPQQTLPLLSTDLEEGDGYTAIDYRLNQMIPYSYLQEQSIVYSDNTATNMLVRGLNGFNTFRSLLEAYASEKLPAEFYTQNVVNMRYMLDVMKTLVKHDDHYALLISQMKEASLGMYLQQSSDTFEIAQKYGMYDTYYHVTGIVYTPKPYIVGIYTNQRADAVDIMGELNEWLIAYQLRK